MFNPAHPDLFRICLANAYKHDAMSKNQIFTAFLKI